MPIYQHFCDSCQKVSEHYRPMAECSKVEVCSCGKETRRVYDFIREDQFEPFFDDQYNCEITSRKQEKALMRQNGHVDGREMPGYNKSFMKSARREFARKPVYFIPGVKTHGHYANR